MFNPDDIVWVNLGKSYGWWPAQVQNTDKKAKLSKRIIEDLGIDFSEDTPALQAQEENVSIYVKFFDDDDKEWYEIRNVKRIQKYSCKEKKKFIKSGFKNLDETKKKGLGGVNLRLAQFYKDVELAEVLTDNDPEVGDILAIYEVSENGDNNVDDLIETNPSQEQEQQIPSSSRQKKSVKKGRGKKSSKDVLREIKSGNIKKSKAKGKK